MVWVCMVVGVFFREYRELGPRLGDPFSSRICISLTGLDCCRFWIHLSSTHQYLSNLTLFVKITIYDVCALISGYSWLIIVFSMCLNKLFYFVLILS